jgi:hypothetical protein
MSKREPDLDESEVTKVEARTLVMFGDDDLMTIAHANATYEGDRGL